MVLLQAMQADLFLANPSLQHNRQLLPLHPQGTRVPLVSIQVHLLGIAFLTPLLYALPGKCRPLVLLCTMFVTPIFSAFHSLPREASSAQVHHLFYFFLLPPHCASMSSPLEPHPESLDLITLGGWVPQSLDQECFQNLLVVPN